MELRVGRHSDLLARHVAGNAVAGGSAAAGTLFRLRRLMAAHADRVVVGGRPSVRIRVRVMTRHTRDFAFLEAVAHGHSQNLPAWQLLALTLILHIHRG